MISYPGTLAAFDNCIPSEDACREHLASLRWGEEFSCPECGHNQGWPVRRGMLRECGKCHYQTSVRAGTILYRSRPSLLQWFRTIWLVSQPEGGITTQALCERLKPLNYRAVSNLRNKLRQVMIAANKSQLTRMVRIGEVTIDVSKHFSGTSKRQGIGEATIIIAAERKWDGKLHVNMKRLIKPSTVERRQFIMDSLQPRSLIITLRDKRYEFLRSMHRFDYSFDRPAAKKQKQDERDQTMLREITEARLDLEQRLDQLRPRAITTLKALDYCLDKFAFQHNNGVGFDRYLVAPAKKTFFALLEHAVQTPPSPA
jgi:hypothetical protein